MKTLKLILLANLLLFCSSCFGQIQNRYWYFGDSLGLDFGPSLNAPTPITGTPNSNFEGVATISDSNGNFLFYTDGRTVRNQSLSLVSDSLNGSPTSSQSGIIVPAPCACDTLFYIFTIDDVLNGNSGMSLQYATVSIDNIGSITVSSPVDLLICTISIHPQELLALFEITQMNSIPIT